MQNLKVIAIILHQPTIHEKLNVKHYCTFQNSLNTSCNIRQLSSFDIFCFHRRWRYKISYIRFFGKIKNAGVRFLVQQGRNMASVREYISLQPLNWFATLLSNSLIDVEATILTCQFCRNKIMNRRELKQVESIWTLFWIVIKETFIAF